MQGWRLPRLLSQSTTPKPSFFVGEEFVEIISAIRDQLDTVRQILVLNSLYLKWRDAQPLLDPGLPVSPDDVCVQLYTSGTTGYPKGVQLSHANFPLQAVDDWKAWSSDDVMLLAMPLFHIAGVGTGVFGLMAGLKTIVLREFVPSQALETIQRDRATITFLVPAMLLAMLAERTSRNSISPRCGKFFRGVPDTARTSQEVAPRFQAYGVFSGLWPDRNHRRHHRSGSRRPFRWR